MLGSKNKAGEFLEGAGLTHSYFDSSWRADGYRREHLWDSQGGRNISSAPAAGWMSLQDVLGREEGDFSSNPNYSVILYCCEAGKGTEADTETDNEGALGVLLSTHPKLRGARELQVCLKGWQCGAALGSIRDGDSDVTSEAVTDRVGTGARSPLQGDKQLTLHVTNTGSRAVI